MTEVGFAEFSLRLNTGIFDAGAAKVEARAAQLAGIVEAQFSNAADGGSKELVNSFANAIAKLENSARNVKLDLVDAQDLSRLKASLNDATQAIAASFSAASKGADLGGKLGRDIEQGIQVAINAAAKLDQQLEAIAAGSSQTRLIDPASIAQLDAASNGLRSLVAIAQQANDTPITLRTEEAQARLEQLESTLRNTGAAATRGLSGIAPALERGTQQTQELTDSLEQAAVAGRQIAVDAVDSAELANAERLLNLLKEVNKEASKERSQKIDPQQIAAAKKELENLNLSKTVTTFEAIGRSIKKDFEDAAKAIQTAIQKSSKDLESSARDVAKELGAALGNGGKSGGLIGGVKNVIQGALGAVGGLAKAVVSPLGLATGGAVALSQVPGAGAASGFLADRATDTLRLGANAIGFAGNVPGPQQGFLQGTAGFLSGSADAIQSVKNGLGSITDALANAAQGLGGFGSSLVDLIQGGAQNISGLVDGFQSLPPELQAIAIASGVAAGGLGLAFGPKALQNLKELTDDGVGRLTNFLQKLLKTQESLIKQESGLAVLRARNATIDDVETRIEDLRILEVAEAKFRSRRDQEANKVARQNGQIGAGELTILNQNRKAQESLEIEAANQRAAKALKELEQQSTETERAAVEAGLASARAIEGIGLAAQESAAKLAELRAVTPEQRVAAAGLSRDAALRRNRLDENTALGSVQRDLDGGKLSPQQAERAVAGIRAKFESERQAIQAGFEQLTEKVANATRESLEAVTRELQSLELENLQAQIQLVDPKQAIALREQVALRRNELALAAELGQIEKRRASGELTSAQASQLRLAAKEAKNLADQLARRDSAESQKEITRQLEAQRRASVAASETLTTQLNQAREALAAAQAAGGNEKDQERLLLLRKQNELRQIQIAFLERQQQILDRVNAGEIDITEAQRQRTVSRAIRDTQRETVNTSTSQGLGDLERERLASTERFRATLTGINQQIREQLALQQQAAGGNAIALATLQKENQLAAEQIRLQAAIAQIEQDRKLSAEQRLQLIAAERNLSEVNQGTITGQSDAAIQEAVKAEQDKAIAARRTLEDLQLQLQTEQAIAGTTAAQIAEQRKAAELRKIELEAARQIEDIQRAIASGQVAPEVGGQQIAVVEQLKGFRLEAANRDLANFASRLQEIEQQGQGAAVSIRTLQDAADQVQLETLRIGAQRAEVGGDRRGAIEREKLAADLENEIRLRQRIDEITANSALTEEAQLQQVQEARRLAALQRKLIEEQASARFKALAEEEAQALVQAREKAQSRLSAIEDKRRQAIEQQVQRNKQARQQIADSGLDLQEQQASLALRAVQSDPNARRSQRLQAIDDNAIQRAAIETQRLERELRKVQALQVDPKARAALEAQAQEYSRIRQQVIQLEREESKRQLDGGNGKGAFVGGLIGGALSGVASQAINSLTQLPQTFLQIGGSAEQTRSTLELFTGSTEKASEVYAQLTDLAAKTPLTLNSVAEVNANLNAYGLSADKAIDVTRRLADVTRGNDEAFKRVSITLGQVISLNKLQGDNLREFQSAGIPILQALQDVTGKSAAEVQNLLSNGGVDANLTLKSLESLTDQGGRFFGLAAKQSETFLGRLSSFVDTFQQKLVGIFDRLSPQLKGVLAQATVALDGFLGSPVIAAGTLALQGVLAAVAAIPAPVVQVGAAFTALATAIAIATAAQIAFQAASDSAFFSQLVGNLNKVKAAITGLTFANVVAGAGQAASAIGAFAVAATPVVATAALAGAAIVSLSEAFESIKLSLQSFGAFRDGVNFEELDKALGNAKQKVDDVGNAADSNKDKTKGFFDELLKRAQEFIQRAAPIISFFKILEDINNAQSNLQATNAAGDLDKLSQRVDEQFRKVNAAREKLRGGGVDDVFKANKAELDNQLAGLRRLAQEQQKIADNAGTGDASESLRRGALLTKAEIDKLITSTNGEVESLAKLRAESVDNRNAAEKLTDAFKEQAAALDLKAKIKTLDVEEALATGKINADTAALQKNAIAAETAQQSLKNFAAEREELNKLVAAGQLSTKSDEFIKRDRELKDNVTKTELDLRQAQIDRINTVNEQDKKTKEEQKQRLRELSQLTRELTNLQLEQVQERLNQFAALGQSLQSLAQARLDNATSVVDLAIARIDRGLDTLRKQNDEQDRVASKAEQALQRRIDKLPQGSDERVRLERELAALQERNQEERFKREQAFEAAQEKAQKQKEEQEAKKAEIQLKGLIDAQKIEERLVELKGKQLEIQQRIAEQQAKSALVDAQAGLVDAQATKDPNKIKLAQQLVGLREQGVQLVQSNRPLIDQIRSSEQQQTQLQGQTALNQLRGQSPSLDQRLGSATLRDLIQQSALQTQRREPRLMINADGSITQEDLFQLPQKFAAPIEQLSQATNTFAESAQQLPQIGAPLQEATVATQQASAGFAEAARTMSSAVGVFDAATRLYADASGNLVNGFGQVLGSLAQTVQQLAGSGGANRSAALPAAGVF